MRKRRYRQMAGIITSRTCETDFPKLTRIMVCPGLPQLDSHLSVKQEGVLLKTKLCHILLSSLEAIHTCYHSSVGNPATGCNWVLRMFLKRISQMLAWGSPQSARRILLFPGKVRKWISMMINWFYSKDFSLFWKDYSVLWCFCCERSMYAETGVSPVWNFCCLHLLCGQECPRPSLGFLALSWALLLIHWPCRLCLLHRDCVHVVSKNTLQAVFDALPFSHTHCMVCS